MKNKNNENRTALLKDAIKKAIHADLAIDVNSLHRPAFRVRTK